MPPITDKHSKPKLTCDPMFHRYYSLEPLATENGNKILIVSICSNCGDAIEYRTSIDSPQ